MSRRNVNAVVRYLQRLTGAAGAACAGDAELLERYVRHRDEAAFELLLWRHGTLVFNVCRRLLICEQDAEDAFQATFLAFVRKAGSIHRRGSVASWLYKVAYRVALEARERARKTAAAEKPGGEPLAVVSVADPLWSDVRPILDEELNRLPERLRRPIVLCYLEGKSNEEAARELGCRLGTIYSRLSRGREILRRRLLRRGVTLSIAALATALVQHASEAAPAVPLVQSAARMALSFAVAPADSDLSPRVAELAEGVLRSMFVTKLKIAAVMVFVATLLAAGGVLSHGLTAPPQPEAKAEQPPPKPQGDNKNEAKPIAVKVVKPTKGGETLTQTWAGEVVAARQQQVGPLVAGTVKEVLVDIGDRVKKGQTLIVLDAPLLAKEWEQATSAFEMAQAEELEAEARITTAKAEVEAAEALFKAREAERTAAMAALVETKAVLKTRQEAAEKSRDGPRGIEEAKSKVLIANAQVKTVEATLAPARAEIRIKEGKLAHAKAALKTAIAATRTAHAVMDKARIQADFTQLKAAFDGVVTRRTIDPGNYVQPSDARLLRPLLTVQSVDMLRLVVSVSDWEVRHIKRGMPVQVKFPGLRGQEYKVSRFSSVLVGGRDGQREMTVEIDIPNTENRLLPGMLGQVKSHEQPPPNTLVVPSSCVFGTRDDEETDETYLWTVRDGKAHRTPVTVRIVGEKNAEITRGITASDLIAVSNLKELKEGTPVNAEPIKWP